MTITCGECLTRWSRWSLRRAWWRMGFDVDGRYAWLHRPFWRKPDFCPECIHDF